jgi:hypothetical protein
VPHTYRVGVKNRWLLGDLDHLFVRLAHRERDLNLAESAPSKLRTAIDFLKFAQPGLRYEILSATDPGPFMHELSHYTRTLAAAVARRARRGVARRSFGRLRMPRPFVQR